MTEFELAAQLAELANLSPDKKMDKLVETAMRNALNISHCTNELRRMSDILDQLPQKCLGQRLECEGKFSEIRQSGGSDDLISLGVSKKKMGAVAIALILAILTAIGSAVANWLK